MMIRNKKLAALQTSVCLGLALSGLALSVPIANAHHSFAATFQADARITVDGTVTKLVFKNPHVLVYMDVTGDDGSVSQWVAEGPSAISMRRDGWSPDIVKIGDAISVYGDSTHDGSPMVSLERVWRLDAQTKARGEQILIDEEGDTTFEIVKPEFNVLPLKRADGTPNLSALWSNRMDAQTVGARLPAAPYNAAGKARVEIADIRHDPQVFCDNPGLIRQIIQNPYPILIEQHDDHVVIIYEEYSGRRVIPLGGSLPADGVKSRLGDSVARYEGDTLVIETANFLENMTTTRGDHVSDQATTIERYKRVDDDEVGARIDIDITVTDPVYYSEPYVVQRSKSIVADYQFTENACENPLRERTIVSQYTSFFLTDIGLGDGANLGGLEGADAHCEALASYVSQGGKGWRAYLSTTGERGVNAIDRIGSGPWYNPRGELIAANREDLIAAHGITKANVVSQSAGYINARGDTPNRHDILTGTQNDGTALNNGEDTTCSNWTSNSDVEGSALVGHYDRIGGGSDPSSWSSAHGSRGCSQANLQGTGGDGLFYCFATTNLKSAPLDTKALFPIGEKTAASGKTNASEKISSSDDKGGKGWLYGLLVIALLGFGFFVARKSKNPT